MKIIYQNVDDYIASFPKDVQLILNKIRALIKEIAPTSIEKISYGMPGYKINGKVFLYFAAFKNHIGFYATPNAHIAFAKELSNYKHGKGSVQFPLNKEIPFKLIEQIIKYRVEEITQ